MRPRAREDRGFDFEHPPVVDGPRLHDEVPPERWCVVRSDLVHLRRLVRRRVLDGRIEPTPRDTFDAFDESIGPCIHTVNRQLIVPITERAGRPSWALMLHPDGLLCDLFVTHGWAEGIYEFIDKVLNSWPREAKHVYCCMLSNPQCLDIGGLIGSPRESPFARALLAAPCMLVVPNQSGSIYSRVWCAYEAFLAYSDAKVIKTATAPVKRLTHHLGFMSLTIAAAVVVSWFAFCRINTAEFKRVQGVMYLLGTAPLLVASCIPLFPMALALLYANAAGAACMTAWFGNLFLLSHDDFVRRVVHVHGFVLGLTYCAATLVAEADRLWQIQAEQEARQLLKGYTGSLRDAQSTEPDDKDRIMHELSASGLEEEVNRAIEVLLVAGASTPTLRAAIRKAGMLKQAGYTPKSLVIMSWTSWTVASCSYPVSRLVVYYSEWARDWCTRGVWPEHEFYCTPPNANVYINAFGTLEGFAWLLLFTCIPWDRRGFAARALVTLVGVGMTVLFVPTKLLGHTQADLHWERRVIVFGIAPVMLALSAAGPARVASIPWVGPSLVRLLMQTACTGPADWPCGLAGSGCGFEA